MEAYLILEDGTVFIGTSIDSQHEAINEIVFNTSITGHLEALVDPLYTGQAVTTAYPLISNYGTYHEDMESAKSWLDGYIVRELPRIPSNFRSEDTTQNFLKGHDIPGISGIDTRVLTKILGERGTMNGMTTTKEYTDFSEPTGHMKGYNTTGIVLRTSMEKKYVLPERSEAPGGSFPGTGKKMVLMDYGAKKNTARSLNSLGYEVTVYLANIPAEKVLATYPDNIMPSNGPGDPKENTAIIEEIKKLYASDIPISAICLGHQLTALASGVDIYRLKYGHRGGNHPVKDLETERVYISSQNHGYAVDMERVNPGTTVPAFVNVNDGTNEGLKYMGKNIFMVQYHPEACPGSLGSGYLFDRSLKIVEIEN